MKIITHKPIEKVAPKKPVVKKPIVKEVSKMEIETENKDN